MTPTRRRSAPPAAIADPALNASVDPADERNPCNVYGPYGFYKCVQFPSGSTGTTVFDGVVGGTVNGYLCRANAGQRMSFELLSESAVLDLYAPDDRLLTGGRYAFADVFGGVGVVEVPSDLEALLSSAC